MRYIQKQEYNKGISEELQAFEDWKVAQEIDAKVADENISFKTIWSIFRDDNKEQYDKLKAVLVKEQGYLCAYCGSRIGIDSNTPIEHIAPKSLPENKDKVLSYHNFVAVCKGGTKDIVYLIAEEKEVNLGNIAKFYGVSLDKLKQLDAKRILVFKKSPQNHCDNAKGDEIIRITPLMIGCEDRFTYLPYGEEIHPCKEDDAEALQTIELLELNNVDYLKDGRGNMMKAAVVAYTEITSQLPITEWQNALQSLIESYQEKNIEGYLEPYCFVAISFLKDCL
jgi:uncharacterized protein (TIGR02646 family)